MFSVRFVIEFILRKIIPGVLIVASFFCNTMVLKIYSDKTFKKRYGLFFVRMLAVSNMCTIPQITFIYIFQIAELDLSALSSVSCKLIRFTYYAIWPTSAWILVYLSVERYLIIALSFSINFFTKHTTQIFTIVLIICFNLVYNSPYFFLYDVQTFDVPLNSVLLPSTSNTTL